MISISEKNVVSVGMKRALHQFSQLTNRMLSIRILNSDQILLTNNTLKNFGV